MKKKMIQYKCPGCGRILEVSRSDAGKNIKCVKCGDIFTTAHILQISYLPAAIILGVWFLVFLLLAIL